MASFKWLTGLAILLCCVSAMQAQTNADYSRFSDVFARGTTEDKRNALFEIRNLKNADASRTAIPALRDTDEIVRATAAFSVIYLPREEASDALLPNLKDAAEIVRRETAFALGKVRDPRAARPIIEQFAREKKKTEVRAAFIVALGEIGDAAALEFLTSFLNAKPKDENAFERRAAARSIGQIAQTIQFGESATTTPESFLPEKLKTAPREKYRNLSAESTQFSTAVKTLISILQNPKETEDTRREAAFALGAIADPTAKSILTSKLTDADYYLAEICKEALTKIVR